MRLDSAEEFEAVYQQYAQPIYRFIYWQTQNPDQAQDLTSLVFERAWRARASFKGGSVQAWLYRIARNSVIDHWRKKKELLVDDVEGLTETPADNQAPYDFDQERLLERLTEALATLPGELRAVVVLRFIEGLSARQVAEILEISEVNVRVIQYRALKKMRKQIDGQT